MELIRYRENSMLAIIVQSGAANLALLGLFGFMVVMYMTWKNHPLMIPVAAVTAVVLALATIRVQQWQHENKTTTNEITTHFLGEVRFFYSPLT